MRDQTNPIRSFINSTRKCCSSLGGLVSSLISRHCTFLVGSPPGCPAESEDNQSTEMDPIDISSTDSDSDSWDLAKYKALNDKDDPLLMDSATSTNGTHLHPTASTSGTGVTGHHSARKVPGSKKASHFNGNSSSNNHAQGRPHIHPRSSDNGYGGRTLPSSLQASGSNARPNPLNSAGHSRTNENHGNPSLSPLPTPLYGKNLINDHMSWGRDAEVLMYGRHPSSLFSNSTPTTQYASPNDPLHRSGVIDEKVGDERLIFQASLQDLNQPKVEATLPNGLLSVSLLKHQRIALAWMHSKETKSAACRGGILADDQAYAAAGTLKQNYANILLMLLRLRQACDHPLLVKGFNSDSVSRVSGKMAKRLPRDMQIDLLKQLETSLAICCVCREEKRKMVASAFGEDSSGTTATRLTAEDLRYLFMGVY